MANIKFIKSDALNHLTDCVKSGEKKVIDLFLEDTNEKLMNYLFDTFNGAECFGETHHPLPDFNLDPTPVGAGEINNLKSVYSKLTSLTQAEASDKRFWVGLCICHAWAYVKQRWNIGVKPDKNQSRIGDHFLYAQSLRRSHTRNALARLWWIARLTYDENQIGDEFHLAKFVLSDTDYVITLLERNYSNNPNVVREFISAISQARAEGYKIDRIQMRQCGIHLHLLGGVYMLDAMAPGTVFNKIYEKAKTFGK